MQAHDLALAYSLSTIAGLRAAFMILVVSAATHLNIVHPPQTVAWIGSDLTLVLAAVFTAADFFGDKIPWIDHGLHAIHTVLAPVSGGIAATAVGGVDPQVATLLGIAGGVNALGVHGVRSATRAGSTATTFGVLTPFISLFEDALAIIAVIVAFVAPFFAAVVAVMATLAVVVFGRKLVRRFFNRKLAPNQGTLAPPVRASERQL